MFYTHQFHENIILVFPKTIVNWNNYKTNDKITKYFTSSSTSVTFKKSSYSNRDGEMNEDVDVN